MGRANVFAALQVNNNALQQPNISAHNNAAIEIILLLQSASAKFA
jgi:hypothetical protein